MVQLHKYFVNPIRDYLFCFNSQSASSYPKSYTSPDLSSPRRLCPCKAVFTLALRSALKVSESIWKFLYRSLLQKIILSSCFTENIYFAFFGLRSIFTSYRIPGKLFFCEHRMSVHCSLVPIFMLEASVVSLASLSLRIMRTLGTFAHAQLRALWTGNFAIEPGKGLFKYFSSFLVLLV